MGTKKPNVLYIVLDDLGFSQLGCYGSTIHTPNLDRLAEEGLRYNNFHTTAICSATRASLLTGANHHSVGIGHVVETVTGFQNGLGGIDPHFGTLAEILKTYDYRTMAVGKWHLAKNDVRTAAGPFNNWPLGKGFDTYYGFLDADMDQWHPMLTRDNTRVEQPKQPKDGYHLSEDLTDNAIEYVYHHHLEYPEQPFFLYLAYGAMHTPHHAPQEYINRYKGKFDKGWDAIREEWFENQKRLGIVNENAELTDRNEYVKAWDSLSEREKKAAARYMEVFAGFLEHTDAQIGRLIDYLRDNHILDDTIVVFISDNGASAEGGQNGRYNLNSSMDITGTYDRDVELALEHYDTLGDEYSQPHYPMGWANAGNTPFPWYKQWVHEGGVKDPLIIRYPAAIKDPGAVRRQYNHVSDVTPTVLDLLGLSKPEFIKGVPQQPFEGISFRKTIEDGTAPSDKHVQYFEMNGNRSVYKDGWKAVYNYLNRKKNGDKWELYHVDADYSEKYDVADQYPEKLRELQDEWLIQASKYHVFPMVKLEYMLEKDGLNKGYDNYSAPAKKLVYENVILPHDIANDPGVGRTTHTVTATINRSDTAQQGVILAQGDRFGGSAFYVKDNHLYYAFNVDWDQRFKVVSENEIPLGTVEVSYVFTVTEYNHALVKLYINGEEQGQVEITPLHYTTALILTLKANKYSSVEDADYEAPFEFTGELKKVVIDVPARIAKTSEELERVLHIE